jgi:ABC-type polysaccharide/polyol phosphate transport system ATPase subunit
MTLMSVAGLTKRYPLMTRSGEKGAFLALDDVSFELAAGEVLGILGSNGAGKSTLLKILSRVIRPTSGRAVLRGRVGSLLEVGVGFHPDLTGRENVFLSAAILGLKDSEIRRCFDEIVDFSGVGAFLDAPVRVYSSGMYMRLAFAVAAHLQPDILLVDEVLAVGDAEFQKKCLERLRKLGRHPARSWQACQPGRGGRRDGKLSSRQYNLRRRTRLGFPRRCARRRCRASYLHPRARQIGRDSNQYRR